MAAIDRGPSLRALGLAVPVLAAVLLAMHSERIPTLVSWVQGRGVLAPFVYSALYACAVPMLVPGSLLTLAAGAMFGLWPGVPVVFCGALAGSSLAFLVSRHLARPSVAAWAGAHPRYEAVERAVAHDGVRIVFLLRLTPLIPFTVLNYLLGVTRIRWRDMVLASPGMLPGTVLYVYYGHVIGDVMAVAAGARPPRTPAQYAWLGVGLVAAVLVAWRVSVVARRALDAAAGDGPQKA